MRLLALFLVLLPLEALALSCQRYGVADAYLEAATADARYVIVRGELSFDPAKAPQSHQDDTPAFSAFAGRIEGFHLGAAGTKADFAKDVRIEVACAGPWCPRLEPGDALMFLRRTENGHVLTASACKGFWFPTPLPEQEAALENCLNGKQCEPSSRF